MKRFFPMLFVILIAPMGFWGQEQAPKPTGLTLTVGNPDVKSANNPLDEAEANHVPIYRVTSVAHTISAINFLHQKSTLVDFHGTVLMPAAEGGAKVDSNPGATRVSTFFNKMPAAYHYGPEYLTYVLWAISPEGRPQNLGEVMPNEWGSAKLDTSCPLQSFGMIVTAEPHFAVRWPSDMVVMENIVTKYTNGTPGIVNANFELLRRGDYTAHVSRSEVTPFAFNNTTPLDVYEARNAVRIARWAGADQYAPEAFQKAQQDLQFTEELLNQHKHEKDMIMDAREAAQEAEDARLITLRKLDVERQAETQKAAAAAEVKAESMARAAALNSNRSGASTTPYSDIPKRP